MPDCWGVCNPVKFLQLSGYFTVINCTFICHIKNVFDCFHGVMAQFELTGSSIWLWCMFICSFQMPHRVKQCTMCQHTTYHVTTYHSLNCFDHMIFMPQTCTYQNFVKLLTHLSLIQQISLSLSHYISLARGSPCSIMRSWSEWVWTPQVLLYSLWKKSRKFQNTKFMNWMYFWSSIWNTGVSPKFFNNLGHANL